MPINTKLYSQTIVILNDAKNYWTPSELLVLLYSLARITAASLPFDGAYSILILITDHHHHPRSGYRTNRADCSRAKTDRSAGRPKSAQSKRFDERTKMQSARMTLPKHVHHRMYMALAKTHYNNNHLDYTAARKKIDDKFQ